MEQCVTVELHEITEIIKDFTQNCLSDKSASHTDKQTRKRYESRIMASGETKSMTGNVKSSLTALIIILTAVFGEAIRSNRQQYLNFAPLALVRRKDILFIPS